MFGGRGGSLLARLMPWVVAIVLFFGVSYYFYAPQFEGKSLSQGDIAQYAGMSKDIKEHREATGEDPQWTGNMLSILRRLSSAAQVGLWALWIAL